MPNAQGCYNKTEALSRGGTGVTQPNELYNILINGREVGTIRIADVKEYMDKLWPGVSYSVSEDGKTVDITATVVQLMELRDKRQEAFSKR